MSSPRSYNIRSAEIVVDRYEAPRNRVDIRNIIGEINLYESIYSSYLIGDVTVSDQSQLQTIVNFTGQEKFFFTIEVAEQIYELGPFVIYKTPMIIKGTAGNSSLLTLEFIEEHAFNSYFSQLRGVYQGNITDIIQNTFLNEFDVEFEGERAAQTMKVLGCNRTPLGFCDWLLQRATDDDGLPMFLYSSIKEGIQFKSLGTMLAESNRPLDISLRYTNQTFNDNRTQFAEQATNIHKITMKNQDDMIKIAKQGAVRSTYFTIDPMDDASNVVAFQDYTAQGFLDRLKESQVLPSDNYEIFDEAAREPSSIYVSQINTSKSFGNIRAYDEAPLAEQIRKLSRSSALALLNKQRFDIVIDGYHMLGHEENTSIGTLIDVKIPKDSPAFQSNDEETLLDKKRSGNFLISHVRHKFNIDREYHASLSLTRLTSPDNINDPSREDERVQ